MRKKVEPAIKAKVALEAFKGEKTIAQISSEYGVHPNIVSKWKKEFIKNAGKVFSQTNGNQQNDDKTKIENLYRQIGELKVENDWIKKKLDLLK